MNVNFQYKSFELSNVIIIKNNSGNSVNLTGEEIKSVIETGCEKINLHNCFTRAGNNDIYIKSQSGAISISEGDIHCNVQSQSGKISCEHVILTNVETDSGKINLKNVEKAGFIKSMSGKVTLNNSIADSVTTASGNLSLKNKSHVKGDVITAGVFSIKDSVIDKTLEICSNNVTIGANSIVNEVYMKKPNIEENFINSNYQKIIFIDGVNASNINTIISGVNFPPGNLNLVGVNNIRFSTQNHDFTSGRITQPQENSITIENDAVVKSLRFDGDECTVILKGSARFEGDRNVPGLTVKNA
ncbi:hypothetical protein [Sodalis sp. RH19]|uniref:hypothetical protein n=1 Tax=Sodalis sp. RH19 TaxID=3394334 RepID=UPI0039B590D1